VSLRNAAARAAKLVARSVSVPPTDVCLLRSVRSGNDGRLRVVPWGTSMSLHSASRVPIIYLCSRSRAPTSGAYSFLYTS
jgi:hypothetical protein